MSQSPPTLIPDQAWRRRNIGVVASLENSRRCSHRKWAPLVVGIGAAEHVEVRPCRASWLWNGGLPSGGGFGGRNESVRRVRPRRTRVLCPMMTGGSDAASDPSEHPVSEAGM